jgi:lipopolysaccharide/colanic/teichoic acid biosynthesis glycosyltransferase
MSLIGPRPLLLKYLPYYTNDERLRHTILPGITGWAQINGRNGVNWDKRLAYDIEYVQNMSFKLDFKIFYKTILSVITSKDILLNPELIMKNLDDERKI